MMPTRWPGWTNGVLTLSEPNGAAALLRMSGPSVRTVVGGWLTTLQRDAVPHPNSLGLPAVVRHRTLVTARHFGLTWPVPRTMYLKPLSASPPTGTPPGPFP